MNGGTRFAVAVLAMFGAMVSFYFAFHPGGVQNVNNPSDALKWLINEFQDAVTNGANSSTTA